MARTAAARRYIRRFIPTMLAYVALLFGAMWLDRLFDPTGAALVALSILPALPIIGVLIVMGLYLIEETDEYVKQRIVTAMLFSVGVLLSLSTALGFLQQNGVVGRIEVFWAFPTWCAVWGLAQCWLTWRDRSTEDAA